ncbi:MAG: Rhodanese domain protein [Anaerocolumna sp.]|jgi:rhodanese-related sulfurtransferase|nr:Rhodanese domain protein [Anaerocolumna sp.]
MRLKSFMILLLLLILTTLNGCSTKNKSSDLTYSKITSEEANEMMEDDNSITILDVRTAEEYNSGHIEGAINIPDTEIVDKALELLDDKTDTILVYCRSGRRSALAAANLVKLGYTNVYDFGGIIDWEYDIVTN